jgi:ribosomal protein S18 acetylase RimI-like enzyme
MGNEAVALASAFLNSEWYTPESYFHRLLLERKNRKIELLVAYAGEVIAGFVFIKWRADYPPFAEKSIPEIRDLRVLKEFRRRSIATALLDEAEKRIFQRSPVVGIGVGLYADYGAGQRLYIKRGYVPDGRGLMYNNQPAKPGREVLVDDNLCLYFTKERK